MFKKNLHLCFFKIKCLPSSSSPPLTLETEDDEDDYFYLDTDNYQTTTSSAASLSTSSATESSNPDFSTVFASQRFFVSSPGCSNSILDSCTTTNNNNVDTKLVSGGVAVKKDSPDPFSDFRRSMLEMIESRERETSHLRVVNDDVDENGGENYSNEWEYLHELLLCYLELNPKHMHKFIIEAFSDVLVSRVYPL